MYPLSITASLAAILCISSALPQTTQHFLDLASLPNCARSCSVLMKAATDCLLPTEHTGAIDHPTYLGCSCNNKLLRTLNDVREICGLSCDKKDEAVIEQYYGRICGVTGPYVTSSSVAPSPVRPSYTAPVKASDTTSTMVVVSAQSSLPAIARPQEDIEAPNSW